MPTLIAHYKFENNSSLGEDSSSNGYNLTLLNNTITQNSDSKINEYSIEFDNGNFETNDIKFSEQTAFTIAFWFKSNSNSGDFHFLEQGSHGTNNFLHLQWKETSGGTIRFGFFGNDLDYSFSRSEYYDTWVHLAFVCKSNNNREIYVNGIKVTSDSNTSNLTNSSDKKLYIGSFNNYFYDDGLLDDMRFYNGVLSASEVSNLANRPLILLAHYNFEDTTNLGKDISGNGNNLTTNGTITSITSAKVGSRAVEYSNGYFSVASSSIDLSRRSFSVSMWVWVDNSSNSGDIELLSQGSAGTNGYLHFRWKSNGKVLFGLYSNDIETDTSFDRTTYSQTWVHFVFTYNQTGYRSIYVNGGTANGGSGIQKEDTNTSNFVNSNNALAINIFINDKESDVRMDDLKIYEGVLKSTEITNLYTHYDLNDSTPSNWSNLSSDILISEGWINDKQTKFTRRHDSVKNYFNYLKQLGSNIYGPNAKLETSLALNTPL